MSLKTDHLHINRVLQGDTRAYAELVKKYQNMVFTMALRMLRNREEAEEVAQDVFVKAYTNLEKFKGDSKFATWLYRIAYNACLDHIKKQKRTIASDIIDEVNEGDLGSIQDALGYLEEEERKQHIKKAIAQLAPDESAVITLFYFEELSLKEISKAVGISESNVKVKLFRSRKKLFAILKQVVKTEII